MNSLGAHIGPSGKFASMDKAVWRRKEGGKMEVVVKQLNKDATEDDKIKFLQEAVILSQFSHTNIVKLYGVVIEEGKVT